MLATFIQQQRKKHKLSQSDLAEALRLSRPTYVQIETGERDLTIPEAKKLSEIFQITFNDFLKARETIPTDVYITPKKKKQEALPEPRISIPQERADKFREILLYILKKVGGKPNIGMTVLYKLLYFIDFDFYEKYEEQLMGLSYFKNHYGPTPVLFKKIMDKLIQQGKVEAVKCKFYQFPQIKYLINPTIEPDLSILNGQEKEHIDWELRRLSDLTANQISHLSHQDVPWISAEEGKPLDYESVFYRTPETSVRDDHADEIN